MTRAVLFWTPSGSCPLCLTPPCYQLQKPPETAALFLLGSSFPGARLRANPESSTAHRVWIPGSLASLSPRNDERREAGNHIPCLINGPLDSRPRARNDLFIIS